MAFERAQTIVKAIGGPLVAITDADYLESSAPPPDADEDWPEPDEIPALVDRLRKEMRRAATALEFERAAELRDRVHAIERHQLGLLDAGRG